LEGKTLISEQIVQFFEKMKMSRHTVVCVCQE
jgi:hypothetical protein